MSELPCPARRGGFHRDMKSWLTFFLGFTAFVPSEAGWTAGRFTELGELPGNAVAWEREVTSGARTVRLSGVSFSAKDSVLRVIDNPPEARVSLSAALVSASAVAGVNGGYFHKDFTPLGLVVSDGETLHAYERAKLLSGIIAVRNGRIELVRSGELKENQPLQEALQAGPWLVENGAAIASLNAEKLARRTLVAGDGTGNWALVATSPLTLAETAEVLLLKDLPGGWTIRNALNLDGGSSTALVALSGDRAVIDIPSFGPVRNYLAIVPRHR